MDIRKIQRSGTTYYVYLPASWCKDNNITTDTEVYLEKNQFGGLTISKERQSETLPTLNLELTDNNPNVINNMIVASYINPVKKFNVKLNSNLDANQILEHKKIFGGLDFLEFQEKSIYCNTTISIEEPRILLGSMIKKIISILRLIKEDTAKELVVKYEEEIDKGNLLIRKSIIGALTYRKSIKIKYIELFYISHLSKSLEHFADILIKIRKDNEILDPILPILKKIEEILENNDQAHVISLIKQVSKLERVKVTDTETYFRETLIGLLENISEIFSDWLITNKIEKE